MQGFLKSRLKSLRSSSDFHEAALTGLGRCAHGRFWSKKWAVAGLQETKGRNTGVLSGDSCMLDLLDFRNGVLVRLKLVVVSSEA